MYTTDSINVDQATYAKPLFNRKNIIEAVKNDLTAQWAKELDTKHEKDVAEFKQKDELYMILLMAVASFDQHKEYFESIIDQHIKKNVHKKYSYVGYTEENKIATNVTKFLIDNDDFTYEELYNFVTKDITRD